MFLRKEMKKFVLSHGLNGLESVIDLGKYQLVFREILTQPGVDSEQLVRWLVEHGNAEWAYTYAWYYEEKISPIDFGKLVGVIISAKDPEWAARCLQQFGGLNQFIVERLADIVIDSGDISWIKMICELQVRLTPKQRYKLTESMFSKYS